MQNKSFITVVGVVIVIVLAAGACAAGFIAGVGFQGASNGPLANLPFFNPSGAQQEGESEVQHASSSNDVDALFKPFWQAWDLVNDSFVDQPVDQKVLMRGAIKGMMEALGDEHSSYLDPVMFEQTQAQLDGQEYEGIGAWVDVTKEYLTVVAPMPDSPAEKAGLRPGDQVIAIDGEDMTGKDGEYARQHVLGPAGSKVILTILREDTPEPFDVEVERAPILVPTVTGEMEENNIAYVRLYTFGDDTSDSLRKELKELLAQNPDGLILDLRNNGGGYLKTGIEVASEFIGDGPVMIEEFGDGRKDTYKASSGGLATKIPLVVLVNEGSASASEIVAGAIQDRERGYLVGTTTYGKGSVQNFVPLDGNEGAVRVTIARWLTPNGRQIHKLGLTPDFVVEYTEEDAKSGIDPQLAKAIEVLTKKLIPPPTAIPTATPEATAVP